MFWTDLKLIKTILFTHLTLFFTDLRTFHSNLKNLKIKLILVSLSSSWINNNILFLCIFYYSRFYHLCIYHLVYGHFQFFDTQTSFFSMNHHSISFLFAFLVSKMYFKIFSTFSVLKFSRRTTTKNDVFSSPFLFFLS